MPPLPRRVLLYVAVVTSVALGLAAFSAAAWVAPAPHQWAMAALLAPMLAISFRFSLHLAPKMSHDVGPAPIMAAAILLPLPLGVATVFAGSFVGELGKPTRRPAQVLFNTACVVVSLASARLAGGGLGGEDLYRPANLVVAALVYWVTVNVLTELIVALHIGQRPFKAWVARTREPVLHEWALIILGVIMGLLCQAFPWALALLPAPAWVVYRSLALQQERAKAAEAARSEAEGQSARLTAIIEATPDFVATADPTGTVMYLNDAGRRMADLREETLFSIDTVIPSWDEQAASAELHGQWAGESEVVATTGRRVPVSQVVLVHRAAEEVAFLSTIARDITAQKEIEQRLSHLADHDILTGLLNRRGFDDSLHRLLTEASASGAAGAVVFADLDGFKAVNDTFGHDAGDALLAAIGNGLAGALAADAEVIARLGGDEFAAVFPGATGEAARALAQRFTSVVGAAAATEAVGVPVGVSVGIALYPEHGDRLRDLVAHADAAMYQAKRERLGVVVFDEAA